ncbi:hypothetical protein MSAN_00291300 [Mycena sanguinolenta]|uniref:CsbD-like domain-containing protein n=1 Tax=Mycena sanguinolenta TaxID=230812 RepID=A0A8H6ZAQ2_9AGAR|nr:hypothetical protein MSAN_00291300 [Mycena sanguinolenta]
MNTSSQTDGKMNNAIGSAKETVGNMTGSTSMQQDGQQQQAKGKVQENVGSLVDSTMGALGSVTSTVGNTVDQLTGTLKNATGAMTGNNTQQAEGECLSSLFPFTLLARVSPSTHLFFSPSLALRADADHPLTGKMQETTGGLKKDMNM